MSEWRCRWFGHNLYRHGSRILVEREWENSVSATVAYAWRCERCGHIRITSPSADLLTFYARAELPRELAYHDMRVDPFIARSSEPNVG